MPAACAVSRTAASGNGRKRDDFDPEVYYRKKRGMTAASLIIAAEDDPTQDLATVSGEECRMAEQVKIYGKAG